MLGQSIIHPTVVMDPSSWPLGHAFCTKVMKALQSLFMCGHYYSIQRVISDHLLLVHVLCGLGRWNRVHVFFFPPPICLIDVIRVMLS